MTYKFRAIFICITIFLIFGTYSFADDTSLGRTPEGVYPINNNDIEMVDEIVNIYLKEGRVECIFTFKNTGKENTVLMGFPATLDNNYIENSPGESEDSIIKNFKAFDDNEKLPVKLENEVKVNLDLDDFKKRNWYDKWYTFKVPFKAGETKKIINTYEYKAPVSAIGPGLKTTGYVLDTGAFWKDNIGHAKIIFHLGDILFTRIDSFYPYDLEGITLNKDKLIFEKTNFEPDFNLKFNYWLDSANPNESDPYYALFNYKRHMRINRYYELTKSKDKDHEFKKAVSKGNPIEILYLLNKINKEKYKLSAPEIGEFLVDNENELDISVIDYTGDLKSIKYEIFSIKNPDDILYEKVIDINKKSTRGFKYKNVINPRKYKSESNIKVKISAIDYKDNTMNYETDIYFDGNSKEVIKAYKEIKWIDNDINSEDIEIIKGNNNKDLIFYFFIGLLIIICIIQQVKISRLK
ncbi:MAG: hypothetical protein FH753_09070 [Firmicutes bacterium]|nr:hypothetical protein [Bacillota bacterium]